MCYMEPNCVSINLEDLKREGNICANQTMFQMKVSSAASSLRIAVLYLSGHRGKTCIVPFFMSVGLYRSLICTLSPLISTATESLQQQQPLFEEWHLSS